MMKNTKKALVYAALAVIAFIALLMTACSDSPIIGSPTDTAENPPAVEEDPFQPPPPIEMPLVISRWGKAGEYMGHQWESDYLKLSDYTRIKPKRGDVLQFNINGSSDKELKYISIGVFQGHDIKNDNNRKWLGGSNGRVNIGKNFTNIPFNVLITTDINNFDGDIYVQVVNVLWELDPSGDSIYGDSEKLQDSVLDGTLIANISNFTMTVYKKTIEDMTEEERWGYFSMPDSTAKLTHFSIGNDNTVKAIVEGTPEQQGDGVWNAWKVSLQYFYTAKTNTSYTYKFMARTESGTRKLSTQYYGDNDTSTYWGVEKELTSTWQIFTIKGNTIPKGGVHDFSFQLANGIGTVYIQIISITESIDIPKTITVTGFPTNAVHAVMRVFNDDIVVVASSWGSKSGNTFSFSLHDDSADEPWSESGYYYLSIDVNTTGGDDDWGNWYWYTNGQPFNDGSGLLKYNITAVNSTIAFNKFALGPVIVGGGEPAIFDPVNPSPLTANTWKHGMITYSGGKDWYTISVISGTKYYLWWNDAYVGDGTKTLDIDVYAWYSNANVISLLDNDSAWETPVSFTASSTGTVYIGVRAWAGGGSSGTYSIVYNTTGIKP